MGSRSACREGRRRPRGPAGPVARPTSRALPDPRRPPAASGRHGERCPWPSSAFSAAPALLLLLLLLLLAGNFPPGASAFYLPGLSPKAYSDRQRVPLQVNKFSSDVTQLPFAYYDTGFVCTPKDGVQHALLNLGEIFQGDRIMNSDYEVRMGIDTRCKKLCDKAIDAKTAESLRSMIKDDYHAEWFLDDLPAATPYTTKENLDKQYEASFPLGKYTKDGKAYLNNHITMKILYNSKPDDPTAHYIVGFEVYPKSVDIPDGSCPEDIAMADNRNPQLEITGNDMTLPWTYSVFWKEEKNIGWANRWDLYLLSSDPQIHWYSIVNSLIIMLFLTAMVAIIMLRTLNKDIAHYNEEDLREEQEDTTGWKLVYGDVFRPPRYGSLLAPLLGSGVQMLLMTVITLVFAVLGILNPSYRGGIVSFGLFLYVFMGTFAGYYSSRMLKVFRGTSWKRNAVVTALLCPGVIIMMVFGLNLFVWSRRSSSALPFGTFFALGLMWIGISLPLVVLGAYFGWKKSSIEHPVRTNQIPRQVPEQIWYLKPVVSVLVGGLMPFAVCFIELFFIMKSIWQDQYYYMFGFLGLVGGILIVTIVEITIMIVYFQLCGEDYHWWWRSFLVGASSSFYIFAYAIYYASRLHIHEFVPLMVYFIDSLVACMVYALCTGCIGFFSTYAFLIHVYSRIKLE